MHPAFGAAPARRRALGLTVGLAEHHVGGLLVDAGNPVPYQHPVIAGVGHHHVVVAPRNAQVHPAR